MKDLTVSVARGLAIIFMVIGHAGCWPWLYDFLYKFHMPIFFFVSGYCFKEKYLNDSKTFIFHRFKGLWWPYVKWMLVFLLLHNIFFRINLYDESMTFAGHTIHAYGLKELCVRAVRILFMRPDAIEPYLGPLWLMPYFLVTSILGFFTIKFSRNIFLGAGFWLIVSMLLKFMSISIPVVGFDWVYAFYLSIFLLGFLFKSINKWANIFEIILIFVVILIVSFYLPTELYYTPNMFWILAMYVVALLGIYMTMSFSHCLVISDRFNSVKFFSRTVEINRYRFLFGICWPLN